MIGKDLYRIYAPDGAKWTEWVRPVPFVAIDKYNRKPIGNWMERKIMFLEQYEKDTAIFVDLLGEESIELGISLAHMGYRPIPIFNGTDQQQFSQATTNTYIIEKSLIVGGEKLKGIKIRDDANPAFLLDSSRMNRYRGKESIFDNSWDIYKQDIPTAEYFKNSGISKIVVVSDKINKDLKKIFFEFQNKEIEIYLTNGYALPQKVIIKKTLIEKLEKEEI